MRIAIVVVLAWSVSARAECDLLVDTDDHAFASARCFDKATSVNAALQAYDVVIGRFATSRHAPEALLRSAQLHAQLVHYAEAARRFEDYAMRFAGEHDARSALRTAIGYRAALGDRVRWIEDTQRFLKMFGTKAADEAAVLWFDLARAFDGDPEATAKHLRVYLRMFSGRGGAERRVLAYARLGDLAWQGSCPIATVDGLCAKRVAPVPSACGNQPSLAAVARAARREKEALVAYSAAVTTFERFSPDDVDARVAYAHAKIALVDHELEVLLATPFPKLAFAPSGASERSRKRFEEWLAIQNRGNVEIRKHYEAVLAIKEPHTSVAAAARLGQLAQAFARSLLGSPLPHDMLNRPGKREAAAAYCDAMREVAEPLVARATEVFATCAGKAAELSIVDEFTRLCDRELTAALPDEFPPLRERIATPRAFDVPLAVAAP